MKTRLSLLYMVVATEMELLETTQLHRAQSKSINSEMFKLNVVKVQENNNDFKW